MRNKAEDALQRGCVAWFRLTRRKGQLFAVPNGGSRNIREAANLKRSGVTAGVSDLVLVAPDACIFIELKAPRTYKVGASGKQIIDQRGGEQSDHQKEFQKEVEELGHDYHLVDNIDDFIKIVSKYT